MITKILSLFKGGEKRGGTVPAKKNVTLVMGGTADYAFAIGNVLIGLEKHSPGFVDDVVVYHDGISERDQAAMAKIRQCRFLEYNPAKLLSLPSNSQVERFSWITFARYEMFRYLSESRHVLWMDGDILIQKDISPLIAFGDFVMDKSSRQYPLEYALGAPAAGVDPDRPIYYSGTIVVSDRMKVDWESFTDLLYDKTVEYWDTLYLQDQTIINYAVALANIEVSLMPPGFVYYGLRLGDPGGSAMVHQITENKMWNNGLVNGMSPEWNDNNKKWIRLGGTPYQGEKRNWAFRDGWIIKKFYDFINVASIYEKAVHEYVDGFARHLETTRGMKSTRSGNLLTFSTPYHPDSFFEFTMWNGMISARFITPERRLFDYIRDSGKFALFDETKYRHERVNAVLFRFIPGKPKGKFTISCQTGFDKSFFFPGDYQKSEELLDSIMRINDLLPMFSKDFFETP